MSDKKLEKIITDLAEMEDRCFETIVKLARQGEIVHARDQMNDAMKFAFNRGKAFAQASTVAWLKSQKGKPL